MKDKEKVNKMIYLPKEIFEFVREEAKKEYKSENQYIIDLIVKKMNGE